MRDSVNSSQPQIRNRTAPAPPQPAARVQFGRKWRVGFLDTCAFCKQKIDHAHDIYMYGDFQAFCSTACREDQIAVDEAMDPSSPSSVRKRKHSENS